MAIGVSRALSVVPVPHTPALHTTEVEMDLGAQV